MPSGLQRGLKGGNEVLSLLHGRISVLSRNPSGLQARALSTSHHGASLPRRQSGP